MSHDHNAPPSPIEQRVAALEALLTERGLLPPGFIDAINEKYENEIGPMNGARVVARAWVDPAYKERLLTDATAAIAELGYGGNEGDHMQVCESTESVHHVVVCTLCSCYPWPVLGLPPAWYKDPAYRARMVREPRTLLAELGCDAARRGRRRGLGQLGGAALPGAAAAPGRAPRAWPRSSWPRWSRGTA